MRLLVFGITVAGLAFLPLGSPVVGGEEAAPPAAGLQPSESELISEGSPRPSPVDEKVDGVRTAPSAQQIAAWIVELDDDRYAVREQATAQLLAAGPAALDPLLVAASGDRPEPADRAVWVLRKLSNGQEPRLRRPALERLAQLENRPQVVAAAKQSLAVLRHQEAAEAIKELGGQYIAQQYPAGTERLTIAQVVLDDGWRGGDEGLKYLADLQGVRQVIIIGTDITSEGLATLTNVEMIESLWLYGTKLEADQIPPLRETLPRVTIDYRRGALLGVGGAAPDGPGPAVVADVRTGSSAAAAGIRVGDVIRTFDSQGVRDFKDLTAKIAEHRPGDEVRLEILRGSQHINMTVTLGQWRADQILSQIRPR